MRTQFIPIIVKRWLLITVILALLPAISLAKTATALTDQLVRAAETGNLALVKQLLNKGADINAKDSYGWTALTASAAAGHADVLRLLLDQGADVNATNKNGATALKWALEKRRPDLARLLKTHGAQLTLEVAANLGDMEEVQRLIDAGVNLNASNPDGRTALMGAVRGRHPDVVKLLVEKGADVNAKDESGWTALMLAARTGQAGIVKLLVQRGADTTTKDKRGVTALRHARAEAHEEVVEILEEVGTDRENRSARVRNRTGKSATAYPSTPEGVVEAFVQSALEDMPITTEEMIGCDEILKSQGKYLPNKEDIEANRKTNLIDIGKPWGPNINKYYIITGFEIKEAIKDENRAIVCVLYNRLGWIWLHPLHVAECRSSSVGEKKHEINESGLLEAEIKIVGKQKGWTWDEAGCRFLNITNDTSEVTYNLAKPGELWRITDSYEPYISVSSAIKLLECRMSDRPEVSTTYPSKSQAVKIRHVIEVLQKHLTKH